jgi:hypothetical protein
MKRYSIFNAYSYFGGGKIKEVSEKGWLWLWSQYQEKDWITQEEVAYVEINTKSASQLFVK